MGKLFLSMLIGMAVMLTMNDDAHDGVRASALAVVSAFAQGLSR